MKKTLKKLLFWVLMIPIYLYYVAIVGLTGLWILSVSVVDGLIFWTPFVAIYYVSVVGLISIYDKFVRGETK